jgi:hypothetical protein
LRDLHRVEGEITSLLRAAEAAKGDLGASATTLVESVNRLQSSVTAKIKALEGSKETLKQLLAWKEMQDAIRYLKSDKWPATAPIPTQIHESRIAAALDAVHQRRSEQEIALLVNAITDEELSAAIRKADDLITVVEQSGKPVSARLVELGAVIQEIVAFPRPLSQSSQEVTAIVNGMAADGSKSTATLRTKASAIADSLAAVRAAAIQLHQDFISAEDTFSVMRYEREARANENAAALYEVQVRKSDLKAERHRSRSKLFFYGMLVAQAGVTIASFSLALKHRNLFWGLAACAGLGAVGFGAYVYLYM